MLRLLKISVLLRDVKIRFEKLVFVGEGFSESPDEVI